MLNLTMKVTAKSRNGFTMFANESMARNYALDLLEVDSIREAGTTYEEIRESWNNGTPIETGTGSILFSPRTTS